MYNIKLSLAERNTLLVILDHINSRMIYDEQYGAFVDNGDIVITLDSDEKKELDSIILKISTN